VIRRHISRRSRYASRFTPAHRDRSGRTWLDPTLSPTCCSSRSRCHLRYCAFGSFMLLVWVHALCRCPVAGCCIFQSLFSSSSGSGPPRRSRWRRVPRGSEPVHQTPVRGFSMIGSISRAETCPALRVRAGVRALWPEASAAWPVMGDLVEQRRRARILGMGAPSQSRRRRALVGSFDPLAGREIPADERGTRKGCHPSCETAERHLHPVVSNASREIPTRFSVR
jgi:hypothetical protein